MKKPSPLVASLRAELAGAADATRAPAMQRYMKSEMPFLGVPATERRAICKRLLAAHPPANADAWRRDVLALWREARHREERYAAIALALHRSARAFRTPDALPLFEELIVTGAWWDYVDELAAHGLGELLRTHRAPMRAAMLAWSRSDDLWKRRSAILCQLRFKKDTDLTLLYACIAPSLSSKEFFLRKAIGWALRQYAWTDPEEIRRYVAEHDAELSGLSKREALKNARPAAEVG